MDMAGDLETTIARWNSSYGLFERKIPIIIVKENETIYKNPSHMKEFIVVENYLEVIGLLKAMEIGIDPRSVRRPVLPTVIV